VAQTKAAGTPPLEGMQIGDLASILQQHCRLGYAPDAVTLVALQPGICRELDQASAADVAALLALLEQLDFKPGDATLGLMLRRVEEGGGEGPELKGARESAARPGYEPPGQ